MYQVCNAVASRMRGSMMKELDDLVERHKPMINKNVRVMSNY